MPTSLLFSSCCLLFVFSHLQLPTLAFTLQNSHSQQQDTQDFYPDSVQDAPDAYTWHPSGHPLPDNLEKRAPSVSINQDLVSLASMLRNEAGRRRIQAASSFLTRLGKRSQPEVFDALQGIPSPYYSENAADESNVKPADTFHRSTRRISVNVPLDALSQMIRTERRRKFDARMATVQNKFLDIGKRSQE